MADTNAHHALWQPQLLFQCTHGALTARVHGTGEISFGPGGRRDIADQEIRARDFRLVARASVKYRIKDSVTGEVSIVDQVDYVLRHPYFRDPVHAPDGGLRGAAWWVERGHEDMQRRFDLMIAANEAHPGAFSPQQIMGQAERVIKAKAATDKRLGDVNVRGIRGTDAGHGAPAPEQVEPADLDSEVRNLPPAAAKDAVAAMKAAIGQLFNAKRGE